MERDDDPIDETEKNELMNRYAWSSMPSLPIKNRDRDSLIQETSRIIKRLKYFYDTEYEHRVADGILCALLNELGYQAVVKEWEKIQKWFA